MKTTLNDLLEEYRFLDIFVYFYKTVWEQLVQPYATNNMGDITKTMNAFKAFM